jgi:hypothetical protein
MLASLRHLAMNARVVLSFLSFTLILALIVDYVRMLRLRSRMVSFMASLSSPIADSLHLSASRALSL